MAHLKYLVKSCDGTAGSNISCLPDNVQIGDTFVLTGYPILYPDMNDPFWETWDNNINSIPSTTITYEPRFVYATSNVTCENSIFAPSNPNFQLYTKPTKTTVNNMIPCPNCCNKPNLGPWDLYDTLPNGELSPNFPQETIVGGITFTRPTDQDYENAGCVRRCQDRAVSGTKIQQKKDRKPGDPQTYLYESFKKRLQKLAGIKKTKK